MRIGLVGMGEMGFAFAQRFLGEGHTVVGYDPDRDRARAAAAAGVTVVADPAAVAQQSESVVILVVQTAEHVEQACFAVDGCLSTIAGKVLVVMSSLNPEIVQRVEREAEARDGQVVDATVGSGPQAALTGSLLVMLAGKPGARAAAGPALDVLADAPEVVGDSVGAGQVAKLITQVAMNVNMAGVVESIRIANHYGLDRTLLMRVIERSPGASYISGNWQFLAEVMKTHNVGNNHKDLRAILSRATDRDIETPVAAAAMYALRHEWPVSPHEFSLREEYRVGEQ
jgi:3-hydroxyisobutyrate dehydrogenase-like beta-hydroxyacid dehydrogenase